MARDGISKAAAAAFAAGMRYSGGHTKVWHVNGRSFVTLWGHRIAMKSPGGKVWLSCYGFPTDLTRRRLQAILDALGTGGELFRRQGDMYIRRENGETRNASNPGLSFDPSFCFAP
jgi:hypothetical protein